jgi:Sec-independent protein translocase protein TatA
MYLSPNYPAPVQSRGIGLFDSMDFTEWGFAEWVIVILGAYTAVNLFGDVRSGTRRIRKAAKSRSAKRERKARLQKQLAEL